MRSIKMLEEVFNSEINTINDVKNSINNSYEQCVTEILNCKGRIIFLGVGKSGHICKKIAATFASTGTPSFFVHSTEAVHGDLGMICEEDIVFAISNSGETEEVLNVLPSINAIGAKIFAITKSKKSTLGRNASIVIEIPIKKEADKYNLAPTNSSTATLVIGDAIALTVSQMKGFSKQSFGKYHPGGALGKELQKDGVIK
ncbi:KpsF/GutQ family sugar-phosphate isomerase [Staphylococcus xylosus]|uniref:KpsF/GutQ family sugar-phosphate isomerase n=1 Tax=Staphylococcus pseudoxylosus TaxID=2282419 RepID=UPI000D1D22F4|nr:SIS domain-containing protein [Staphylococcus pseudoxylosus]PTI46252.1 KpsF/GutQ family sugar-phosphate isomerase [Staphylococcus xylosus]MDW8797382.1 SIS domain-containing protein [Staphylococcus pseudoxylosus]MEB6036408.1 SIS domain-containing protein [Staphylococcus pseudoxylosus]MEB6044511.1 SIS domain-containing protein [Staphylococcus pseudoxylosus]MEB6061166.1 SIS domain-containing protein [Staphylococcus pseudoxylosus]